MRKFETFVFHFTSVEQLISIGKFRNYQATGPVNFHKLTLLYGDNGGGKTTLTSVLRSLTSNTPSIVKSRISTNHTAPQAAQIIQRNSTGDTPPIVSSVFSIQYRIVKCRVVILSLRLRIKLDRVCCWYILLAFVGFINFTQQRSGLNGSRNISTAESSVRYLLSAIDQIYK